MAFTNGSPYVAPTRDQNINTSFLVDKLVSDSGLRTDKTMLLLSEIILQKPVSSRCKCLEEVNVH